MFEINEGDLPFVRTRQALFILDLQNDFVGSSGVLKVDKPSDFVEKITGLVPVFRNIGNIFWIRSQFSASRPIDQSTPDSDRVVTDKDLPRGTHIIDGPSGQRVVGVPARMKELYGKLMSESLRDETRVRLEVRDAADEEKEEEPYDNETFLTIEEGNKPRCVLPMTSGVNFPQEIAYVVDDSKDTLCLKTHYSAFKSGTLLQSLRGYFVTELFICGALTNISIFATVMDAARYGFQITLVDDCLGYRNKARHDEARRLLIETAGCEVMQNSEVIDMIQAQLATHQQRQTDDRQRGRGREPRDLHQMMTSLRLEPGADESQSNERPLSSQSRKSHISADNGNPPLHHDSSDSIRLNSDESIESSLYSLKRPEPRENKRVPKKIKTRRRHADPAKVESKNLSSNLKDGETKQSISPTRLTLAGASEVLKSVMPKDGAEVVTSESSSKHLDLEALLDVDSPGNSFSLPEGSNTREKGKTSMVATAVPVTVPELPHLRIIQSSDSPETKRLGQKKGSLNSTEDTNSKMKPTVSTMTSEDTYPICGGDSMIIHNLLPKLEAELIFERVRDEVKWQKMCHQGGEVPRLVAVQGAIDENGSIPIYRHPADESPPLLSFSPTVSIIKQEVEKKLGHQVNHCLIQFYRSGTDYISEHSDKTLDIAPDSFISNVSLGAMRAMTFRTKKPLKNAKASNDDVAPRISCKAPLPHNSMCKMSLSTNEKWLHSIRQDKRLEREKSEAELAYGGCRISLTFRLIGTFLNRDQVKIWGQGAVAKEKKDARSVINGETPEAELMIRAFGKENQSSIFDWKDSYGKGFDVLHMSNTRKLFLSGDTIVDLRVKIALAAKGIEYVEAASSPLFNWNNSPDAEIPETFPVRFIDNDIAKSQVEGDLAVLLYLDSIPNLTFTASTIPTPLQLARKFTRLNQVDALLQAWRALPFDAKKFRSALMVWDGYAREEEFIAASEFGLVDWIFWPVLHRVVAEWRHEMEGQVLLKYYERVLGVKAVRECVAEDVAKKESDRGSP